MKRNLKAFLSILIFITNLLINKNIKAETINYIDKTYKVGVVKLDSYVQVNEKGDLEGYYIDLFDLIAKDLNLKYEYVLLSIADAIDKLENKELDFVLGITLTEERADKVLFNICPIAFEKFALYTNKEINSYNLNDMNGMRFATIKKVENKWILDFFKASNINVDIKYGDNYDEINTWLDNESVDLILDSAYKKTKHKKIYEFIESQVYIAANKDNGEVLNNIDNTIINLNKNEKNKIENLYNSYFNKDKLIKKKVEMLLNNLIQLILLLILIRILLPKIKRIIHIMNIRKLTKKKSNSIYYQPIYKSKDKKIVGFEAILKNKIEDKYVCYCRDLISKFKDNKIISYVCITVLKKVISDYKKIEANNLLNKNNIYLSMNIPINQFINNRFVNKIIKILNKSKLRKNSICIEVMGNINVKNINSIIKNIKRLKEAGFIIAIDDFGIEYSNINMIQKLDIDIIKIDKTFTYNMDKSLINNEIIMFILRIGKSQDKFIVLEGINKLEQYEIIEKMDYDKLYVQGNFYSKPISTEEMINF